MKPLMLTLIFTLFIASTTLFSQGNMYTEINHYGQYFYDIDATDTDVTAAGDNIILNSTDEGVSWKEIKLPSNRTYIKHVSKVSAQHYLAAGNAIYITIDDGKNWEIQEDMDDIISMENFGSTIIITRENEDKRFMRSDDGGSTWVTLSTSNAIDPGNLDYINTDDAFFSDSSGTIYSSFNGGLSWTILNDSQFNEPIESLRFSNIDHGYAQIGDIVWETLDGGQTWIQIIDSFIASKGVFPLPSGLYTWSSTRFAHYSGSNLSYIQNDMEIDDLFSLDLAEGNGKLYMSGPGMILVNDLDNTLEEWSDLTPGPDDGFNSMIIDGQKRIISGGQRIQISNDGGLNYNNEETSISQLSDLNLGPDGTIYITQSGLLKSENDGKDWEFVKSNTKLVHVFDDGRMLIAGGNAISQSTDDGSTFEPLFDIPSGIAYDFYFYDNNLGWYLNSSGNSYRTTDGGGTWEPITFPFGSSPTKMHFVDAQNGFAIKRFTDKFWRTTDGGTTWEEVNFSEGEADLTDVYFDDNMIGYVVGRESTFSEGIVLKTEDAGDSWELFHKGINLFYEITGDETTGKIFVCGERGQLFSYSDCDNITPTIYIHNDRISCNENSEYYKWYLNGTFLVETTVPYIDYVENGVYTVRTIGDNQCISSFSEEIDAVLGTDKLIESSHITLSPNPSSGPIHLDIDSAYHIESVSIYSLAGKYIYKDMSGSKQLDLSHLHSGSYFAKIQMQEGYFVKQIILK